MEKEELLKYVRFLFVETCQSMNMSTELENRKYFEGKRNAYENVIEMLENSDETIEYIKEFYEYLNP